MPNNDWVFWLNLANIALGVIVLLALLIMAYGVVWEIASRRKKAHGLRDLDAEMKEMLRNEMTHGLSVPELGFTMADGGTPLKPKTDQPKEKKNNKE